MVERLLVFADGDRIDAARVDALLHPGARTVASTGRTGFERIVPLAEMEQAYLRWVVDKLDGNVSAAAARLGIARSTIYRLLRAQADEGATLATRGRVAGPVASCNTVAGCDALPATRVRRGSRLFRPSVQRPAWSPLSQTATPPCRQPGDTRTIRAIV